MPRDYDFVFWAYGVREAAELSLSVTDVLQKYGEEYVPVYAGDRKLELTLAGLREEVARNTRGQASGIGLRSENDLVLQIMTDTADYGHIQFPQTLTIIFNLEHLTGEPPNLTFEQLEELFASCLEIFVPHYAYGSKMGEINYSKRYEVLSQTVDSGKVPMVIQWFNFFEPAMVERLGGVDRLLAAPAHKVYQVTEPEGVVLILQREPFDYRDPTHLQRRQAVEDHLKLSHLHQQYPRRTGFQSASQARQASRGQSMRLQLRFPPTPGFAPRHAQLAVEAAHRFDKVRLDYSPKSLVKVDRIILRFHDQQLVPAQIGGTVFAFGCYAGEVLVQHHKGQWRSAADSDRPTEDSSFMVVQLPNGVVANPIGKAFKVLEKGSAESLAYWYQVVTTAGA